MRHLCPRLCGILRVFQLFDLLWGLYPQPHRFFLRPMPSRNLFNVRANDLLILRTRNSFGGQVEWVQLMPRRKFQW